MNPTKEWPVREHKTEALRLVKNWKFDREMRSSRNARQALGEAIRFLMLSRFLTVVYSCNDGEKEVDYIFFKIELELAHATRFCLTSNRPISFASSMEPAVM